MGGLLRLLVLGGANGDPQLSPNLKGDYCARYG